MSLLVQYSAIKQQIATDLGMTESLLHVHLGLAIFVLAALVLRRRMRSSVPILLVLGLELLNEGIDYAVSTDWSWWLSLTDVVNTMLWPTVLFLLARRGPVPATGSIAEEEEAEAEAQR